MVSDESNLDFREFGPGSIMEVTGDQEVKFHPPGLPTGAERIMLFLGRPIPHDQCAEILMGPLQEAVQLFVKRQAEYGESADQLGSKGQFADINRKVIKLKRLMWDENVPADAISEDAEQVCMDLIGHLLLSIYYTGQDERKKVDSELLNAELRCPRCGSRQRGGEVNNICIHPFHAGAHR